jgi:hypothetical protein
LLLVSLMGVLALLPGGLERGGQQVPPASDPTQLGEVLVTASPRLEAAREFVRSVAAPSGDREMALWRDPVCVGVGNMQAEAAQLMADRISDWASSLDLRIGGPGCRPNIFIMATDDGDAAARALVASRPREFRTGVSGSDLGAAALATFQNSGRPVRWWHVSLAVDEDTGAPIRRLPGQPPVEWQGRIMERPTDFGVNSMATTSPSRLSYSGRDDLQQAIIVVDIDALETTSFAQLTDYVAMVALAQIDPAARPANASILHLFDVNAVHEETLTRWDRAFLGGLYQAEQNRAGASGNLSAVAHAMSRELETTDRDPVP